jgi:hypothetical protein
MAMPIFAVITAGASRPQTGISPVSGEEKWQVSGALWKQAPQVSVRISPGCAVKTAF